MMSQRDLDFVKEREARKKIRSLIADVCDCVTNRKVGEPSQVIALAKSFAQQQGLREDLIAWAQIHLSNNKKYPPQRGVVPGLDSLADVNDLIAEAGIQLNSESD